MERIFDADLAHRPAVEYAQVTRVQFVEILPKVTPTVSFGIGFYQAYLARRTRVLLCFCPRHVRFLFRSWSRTLMRNLSDGGKRVSPPSTSPSDPHGVLHVTASPEWPFLSTLHAVSHVTGSPERPLPRVQLVPGGDQALTAVVSPDAYRFTRRTGRNSGLGTAGAVSVSASASASASVSVHARLRCSSARSGGVLSPSVQRADDLL